MTGHNNRLADLIPSLYALAETLEGQGQLNNAKLLRAGAEAVIRRTAYQLSLPTGRSDLQLFMRQAVDELSAFELNPDLLFALQRGTDAMENGRLPLIHESPNAFVCRTCGYLMLGEPQKNCPTCSARPVTFIGFSAVYWLDALEPFEALERLRQTPKEVTTLLAGLSEEQMKHTPESGGWNLHNAVSHLRDAQGVLEMRINLMLEKDNPKLESKAVFEWAERGGEFPETTSEIFDMYELSRGRTIARLESVPFKDWRRTGEHEEFGTLTIQQQVSYFAVHEITHLPQMESLVHS
jgi:hypothetical protein